MLKKAVQQGRSERRAEEVQTALRVDRLPLQWILANGKAPPVLPTSENLFGTLSLRAMQERRWRILSAYCEKKTGPFPANP